MGDIVNTQTEEQNLATQEKLAKLNQEIAWEDAAIKRGMRAAVKRIEVFAERRLRLEALIAERAALVG